MLDLTGCAGSCNVALVVEACSKTYHSKHFLWLLTNRSIRILRLLFVKQRWIIDLLSIWLRQSSLRSTALPHRLIELRTRYISIAQTISQRLSSFGLIRVFLFRTTIQGLAKSRLCNIWTNRANLIWLACSVTLLFLNLFFCSLTRVLGNWSFFTVTKETTNFSKRFLSLFFAV